MFIILYVMLWLLAHVNGIKNRLRWPDDIPRWEDDSPNVGLRIVEQPKDPTSTSRYIILPFQAIDDRDVEAYHNRDALVILKYRKNGTPEKDQKVAVENYFKILVNHRMKTDESTPPIERGFIGVDYYTCRALDHFLNDQKGDGPKPPLRTAQFTMIMRTKKLRGVLFLLWNHPDPTFRTTGWVVTLTGIFAIVQSILFG